MSRLVVVIIIVFFVIFVTPRLILVVIQLSRGVPLSAVVARRSIGVVHDELTTAEDGLGVVMPGDLVLELVMSAPCLMRTCPHYGLNLPYGIRFAVHGVVGGDVLDQTIFDTHHLAKVLFYYWSTEVDGEVRIVVISPSFPALCSVIFMRFLVILQRADGDGVKVIKLTVDWTMSCAWLELWLFGVLSAADWDSEEDKGKDSRCELGAAHGGGMSREKSIQGVDVAKPFFFYIQRLS